MEDIQIASFEILKEEDRLSLRQKRHQVSVASTVGAVLLTIAFLSGVLHFSRDILFWGAASLFPILSWWGIYEAWTAPRRVYEFDKKSGLFTISRKKKCALDSVTSVEIVTTRSENSRNVAVRLRLNDDKSRGLPVSYSSITDEEEFEKRVYTASTVAKIIAEFLNVPVAQSTRHH